MLDKPGTPGAQIDELVRGFMQVWVKFENMLPGDVARLQNVLEGMSPEDVPARNRDYETFFRVSAALRGKPSITMGELSTVLSVPLSRATRTADWLVGRGYIERLADPDDRRVVRVRLTDNGRNLHGVIEENVRRRVFDLLSCLSAAERDTLFRLIGKVVASAGEKTIPP